MNDTNIFLEVNLVGVGNLSCLEHCNSLLLGISTNNICVARQQYIIIIKNDTIGILKANFGEVNVLDCGSRMIIYNDIREHGNLVLISLYHVVVAMDVSQ